MDRLCNALLAVAVAEKMAPATEVALALVASAVAAEATVAAAGEMVTWAAEAMAAAEAAGPAALWQWLNELLDASNQVYLDALPAVLVAVTEYIRRALYGGR